MLIGVAGVPTPHFNTFQKQSGKLAGSGHSVFGVPSKPENGAWKTGASTARTLIDRAIALINADNRNAAEGFGVICLAHEWDDLDAFESELFPAALVLRVKLPFPLVIDGEAGRVAFNTVLGTIGKEVPTLIRATRAMRSEVEARRNRSPVLLPVGNFKSDALRPSIEGLSKALLQAGNPAEKVQTACREIEARHPFKPKGSDKGFRDDADVIFRSPGRDLHGRLWEKPGEGHDARCALNGWFRLGGPIASGFHFDCTRPPRLEGRFCNCHGAEGEFVGKPHLNIAPNDYVRI
ncbi:hypothetical protein [Brevundimonas sp.]|jgi:hypothetical protein|uniref:hypothetical protein n=1 Tax=Brevundimonas sp. TaxID=1871086 RepID=UPI0037BEFD4A